MYVFAAHNKDILIKSPAERKHRTQSKKKKPWHDRGASGWSGKCFQHMRATFVVNIQKRTSKPT